MNRFTAISNFCHDKIEKKKGESLSENEIMLIGEEGLGSLIAHGCIEMVSVPLDNELHSEFDEPDGGIDSLSEEEPKKKKKNKKG